MHALHLMLEYRKFSVEIGQFSSARHILIMRDRFNSNLQCIFLKIYARILCLPVEERIAQKPVVKKSVRRISSKLCYSPWT